MKRPIYKRLQFIRHPKFEDAFIEIKDKVDYGDGLVEFTGRYWIQGATASWPCDDWEIIKMKEEKFHEFIPYKPRNGLMN